MNSILTPLARSGFLRRAPIILRGPHARYQPSLTSIQRPALLQARFAASSVSNKPGSQTLEHAALNVKEEVGNSAADWAKTIAAGNFTQDTVKVDTDPTFIGITSAGASMVPTPYMVMGLAGGLPYIAASGTTVYLAHQAGLAIAGVTTHIDPGVAHTILDQALTFQVTYGAVMLSFLGALHWGMEFAGYGGHKGYSRLLLGAAPILLAWPTLAMEPMQALIVQWVCFTALWWADFRVTSLGWTPKWYSQYRFYLSILVGTCIIGSLAGTSYWGPVAGHGLLSHDLNLIRAERKRSQAERKGVVGGDTEAVPAGEDADKYVRIVKHHEPENEGENEGEGKAEGEDGEKT